MKILKQIMRRIEMSKYDQFTMEDYFRKKGYRVGKNNRIFTTNLGGEPYLVEIGNHCTITQEVSFITHDGASWLFREEIPSLHVFGKIVIKDNCFIGLKSVIMPNVNIGPNSVVGAGAVVTKDVAPNTVVGGVPASYICSTEEYKKKCIERWKTLNLQGPRSTWEEQMVEFFWGDRTHTR